MAAAAIMTTLTMRRPVVEKENLVDTEESVSPETRDLVYFRNCNGSNLTVSTKCAKVIVESCTNCTITVAAGTVSGMVELLKSDSVTAVFTENVPTISLDTCKDCKVTVPTNFGILEQGRVLTCNSASTTLSVNAVDTAITDSTADATTQMVSSREPTGWVTVPVVREGAGHITTADEKEKAEAREAEALAKFEETILGIVDERNERNAALEAAKKEAEATQAAAAAAADNNDDDSESPARPSGGFLAAISGFNKEGLKPTETVERTISDIVVGATATGHGHSSADEIKEFYDSPEELAAKVDQLAELIRASNHVVAYTGAGVSTSAKIPDYRGPAGVWTMRDRGLHAKMDITLEQALPTTCHMALVGMQNAGHLAFTVSTNVDGLHRRSGLAADQLSEVHGNAYREVCSKCNTEYLRSFDVTQQRKDHRTGRTCEMEGCDGLLLDSIINFGENLPEGEYGKAYDHSHEGDFALVLGTSMRVQPACRLPSLIHLKENGHMCIVNLQKTPFDKDATVRIFAKTDEVMEMLCERLGVEIPTYELPEAEPETVVVPNSTSARC